MASQFRNIEAWQRAVALAVDVYRLTSTFPSGERFGLSQQIQRAAVSVPSNIAEGRGRGTARDYRNFLFHARGSAYEVETQLEMAKLLGYVRIEDANTVIAATNRVQRLINGIIRSIDARSS